jgi:small subunit ribosomal protein S10e
MIIPKKNRIAVYSYLFKEGVAVAHKNNYGKHGALDVDNLQVRNLMKSLKSRGYVRETFSWQWHYWYLTNEGIEYLREYLNLPMEIVPATLKKQASRPARPAGAYEGEGGGKGGGKGGRGGYRDRDGDGGGRGFGGGRGGGKGGRGFGGRGGD